MVTVLAATLLQRGRRSFRARQLLEALVKELNPVLRGWGNYFRWGNSTRKFTQVDSFVHERIALYNSKKRGKSGRGWSTVHIYAWFKTIGLHCLSETVRYGPAATAAT